MSTTQYRIAMCIPTWNHPEMIEELLCHYAKEYEKYGVDLFIYDSSDQTEINTVIKELETDNVTLMTPDAELKLYPEYMHANCKVLQLLKALSFNRDYDYIWICGDGARYTSDTLREIQNAINRSRYDVVVLRTSSDQKNENKVYEDVNELMVDYGWWMTLFGSTLINRSAFTDVDWVSVFSRMLVPDIVYYSHVLVMGEVIENKSFKAIYLGKKDVSVSMSPIKLKATWENSTKQFDIVYDSWPKCIRALPDRYKQKESIIDAYYNNVRFFDEERLIRYRADEIYDHDLYERYHSQIARTAGISEHRAAEIALMNVEEARAYVEMVESTVRKFISDHPRLAIYGAGVNGKKLYRYLKRDGFIRCIDCFIVTSKDDNDEMCYGVQVREISSIDRNAGYGIMLGMRADVNEAVLRDVLYEWDKNDLFTRNLKFLY